MSNPRKYSVHLTPEQRVQLRAFTQKGQHAARVILRSQALLLCDEDHPEGQRPDTYIVAALGIKLRTLVRLRKQFVEQGLEAALQRKVRSTPPVVPKITGRVQAQLITLACSKAPAGHSSWSTRLLAEDMVRLNYIPSISKESVRLVLKKTNLSRGSNSGSALLKRIVPASSHRWNKS
jgi:hypothetical protein